MLAQKCIDKNIPVKIWIIKDKPNRDPKFHQIEILIGVGSLIKELLIILSIKFVFSKDLFI